MQDQKEMTQINQFLCMITPIVTSQVRMLLESAGLQVEEEGFGLDAGFSIKSAQRQLKFYLQNLLLEIATIDRDQQPLRFDQNLRDLDYFAAKTAQVVESKLNVLFHLFGEENMDAAIEDIARDAKGYRKKPARMKITQAASCTQPR
jgi:hypothetical protein